MIEYYDQNNIDYQIDYNNKFLSESYREVRDGGYCFVYVKSVLEELKRILEKKGIKYNIESHENDGYWKVMSKGGTQNARRKKEKEEE